jgi:hypothetical protein
MPLYLHTYNLAGNVIHTSSVAEDTPLTDALKQHFQNDAIEVVRYGPARKPHETHGIFSWGPLGGVFILTRATTRKPPKVDPSKIHYNSPLVVSPSAATPRNDA